jgi:hypothetical protein
MRKVLLTLLLSLAAGPLAAQTNAELMANDHYTRSHDYDLVHQRIAVSDFDWDSTSFRGEVTTTLVALRPGLDSIVLDEGALLENTAVTARIIARNPTALGTQARSAASTIGEPW